MMVQPLRLLLLVLVLALAAPAMAQTPALAPPTEAPVFFGLRFPDAVAGFPRGTVVDFEKDRPGLGYDVKYGGNGWVIDVFIYDAGLKDIPDSPRSDVVRGQFAQARADIFRRQQAGGDKVEEKETFQIATPDKTIRFICGAYLIVNKSRQRLDSFLCLTTWKGRFVKYRLTTLRRDGNERTAKRFVSGWIDVLWPGLGAPRTRRAMLGTVL